MASEDEKQGVLLVGGTGVVGGRVARILRTLHPGLPLWIGARDVGRAESLAADLGHARAVRLDLSRPDLGFPEREGPGVVAMLVKDASLGALRFAQDRGAAYLDISTGAFEVAPEIAEYTRRPRAAAIVLGGSWLVGAATALGMHGARAYRSVEAIEIAAVLDEQDIGGQAAVSDYERQMGATGNAQVLERGAWRWIGGEQGQRAFTDVDGQPRTGQAYALLDAVSLAAATDARSVRFDVTVGESSSRRRGEPFSTELILEISGERADGGRGRSRHELVHPEGQAPVTAVGVASVVERLLGLAGGPVAEPGLYLLDSLLDPATTLARLEAFGARIRSVEPGARA